jgi:hypothetical protein
MVTPSSGVYGRFAITTAIPAIAGIVLGIVLGLIPKKKTAAD